LWQGSLATDENLVKWKEMLNRFRDATVVCGDREVYILWLKRRKHTLKITIPEVFCTYTVSLMITNKSLQIQDIDLIHADRTHAAWVLSPNAIEEPCVAFSRGSLLWIYNPTHKGLSSYLRGHGGVRISHLILMIMDDGS